jgi:hypothetical protein
MAEPWLSDAESSTAGPSTAEQETIALLEEEIARLEAEIRIRDLQASAEAPVFGAEQGRAEHDDVVQERIIQLGVELTAREETIALLLEQARLADEAEAASRAEWEQLQNWVQDVERRVAEQAEPASDVREQLASEQRNTDLLRQAAEKERRAWEVQRQALVAEVERLRGKFTEVAGGSDASVAVQALEHENQKLREAYEALAHSTVAQHEMDAKSAELETVRRQHDALARELKQQQDDRKREHNEHEASLNAVRSQLAHESLRRQEEQVRSAAVLPPSKETLLEADMRIRAFREHLKEIHHDEAEQRMRRGLAARLSRLWNHTSTKR